MSIPKHPTPSPSPSPPSTIYFGYGSNLWLHQMHTRCPESSYLGIARLSNYHWLINSRGYANVVEASDSSPSPGSASRASSYANVVFGLVYSLSAADEARLDGNEGVPVAYTKERLECDFWKGTTETRIDTREPADEKVEMLVYIDRQRTAPDEPREEYIYRMNQGITDAVNMGVPEEYVNEVMRKYIPAEHQAASKSLEDFAKGQAVQFKDESGVFE